MTRAPAFSTTKKAPTELTQLILKLKNTKDYRWHKKKFEIFIDKKDPLANDSLTYFLYYDFDSLTYGIDSEISIPHNTLVLLKGIVPSKILVDRKGAQKRIEE